MIATVATVFTACDSDRDWNPVIDTNNLPATFKLNTPAYSTQNLDLESSSSLHFTWSQPVYGYPAVATYTQQISLTDKWEEAEYNAEGVETKAATYYTLSGSSTLVSRDVDAKDFNKGVVKLAGWEEESAVPTDAQTVYVRCISTLAGKQVVSNSVTVKVLPYYVSLIDYPETWYLTGEGINGWMAGDNTPANAKTLPLDIDKETAGKRTKTIYIEAGKGFKIVNVPNNWDKQIGSGDGSSIATVRYKDDSGEGGDFKVTESGYYKVTLTVGKKDCEIKASKVDEAANPIHSKVVLTGSALADDVEMTACSTNGHNHIWYAEVTATKGLLKFKVDGTEYSNGNFPYGYASKASAGIKVVKGTFAVYYDDLSGCYQFYAK